MAFSPDNRPERDTYPSRSIAAPLSNFPYAEPSKVGGQSRAYGLLCIEILIERLALNRQENGTVGSELKLDVGAACLAG